MKKYIFSLLATSFIVCSVYTIYWYYVGHERTNIHYNEAIVTSIGQCNEGVCSYTYKTEFGSIEQGTSRNPVSIGQTIYQECWFEKARGDRCYVNYEPK